MEQAGRELATIMRELLRRVPAEDAPLLAWPVICGPAVAARTRPLLCEAGVLRIEVPDAGWRTELAALEERYLHKFASLLGEDSVRRIEFMSARGGM